MPDPRPNSEPLSESTIENYITGLRTHLFGIRVPLGSDRASQLQFLRDATVDFATNPPPPTVKAESHTTLPAEPENSLPDVTLPAEGYVYTKYPLGGGRQMFSDWTIVTGQSDNEIHNIEKALLPLDAHEKNNYKFWVNSRQINDHPNSAFFQFGEFIGHLAVALEPSRGSQFFQFESHSINPKDLFQLLRHGYPVYTRLYQEDTRVYTHDLMQSAKTNRRADLQFTGWSPRALGEEPMVLWDMPKFREDKYLGARHI